MRVQRFVNVMSRTRPASTVSAIVFPVRVALKADRHAASLEFIRLECDETDRRGKRGAA
jgi:hypothetical protein